MTESLPRREVYTRSPSVNGNTKYDEYENKCQDKLHKKGLTAVYERVDIV